MSVLTSWFLILIYFISIKSLLLGTGLWLSRLTTGNSYIGIIRWALKIHQYVMLCAPVMGQIAANAAIRNGEDEKDKMVTEYRVRRNLFVHDLNRIGLPCHVPEGAFYAFPSVTSTGLSDFEFAEQLLKEERVAVVPGTVFGDAAKDHLRCAYAVSRKDL